MLCIETWIVVISVLNICYTSNGEFQLAVLITKKYLDKMCLHSELKIIIVCFMRHKFFLAFYSNSVFLYCNILLNQFCAPLAFSLSAQSSD